MNDYQKQRCKCGWIWQYQGEYKEGYITCPRCHVKSKLEKITYTICGKCQLAKEDCRCEE